MEGAPLYFESDDVVLRPAAEAFATALFLPALKARVRIAIDAPLDPIYLTRSQRVLPVVREFWGYRGRSPLRGAAASTDFVERSDAVGLCFTGGVDSFHTLLHEPKPVDALVYVAGFDISLDDPARLAAWERSFREIADRIGKKAIVVRTNLRTHPSFARPGWERTHGAALAAVGHVLSHALGRLRIAPTWRYDDPRPWGSSFRLDPHWSSGWIVIEHGDASLSRRDKIPRIADSPLVRRNLRVCWENRTREANCSSCQKCLRTMVGLAACGVLDECETFDHSESLEARIDRLPSIPLHMLTSWGATTSQRVPEPLRDAIARLIVRSKPGDSGS